MPEAPSEDALATTLERLAQQRDTCTLAEFQDQADTLRQAPAFQRALVRAEALASEKRLLTLALLRESGELCACELQAALDCTNPTVSHHMARLEEADLVAAEKRGKWKHYRLTDEGERLCEQVVG